VLGRTAWSSTDPTREGENGNEKKKKKKSRSYELSILPGIPVASPGSLVICTYGAQRERHTYKVYTST
jgi:hypothetical protein